MFRHSISRRAMIGYSGAAAAWAAVGPTSSRADAPKTTRLRIDADIQTLDPSFRVVETESDIMTAIYSKLATFRPGSWELELDAAEHLEQLDERHLAFRLRPGIMFTNGFGEMTSDDVKFSFERIADPQAGSYYRDDWKALDEVEIKDKYSGVVKLKEPFSPLLNVSIPYTSGCILSRKAVEQAGGRIGAEPAASSGPYYLKEWTPKQRIVLARNPEWNGPEPGFDEIVVIPVEDNRTAELAFLAGDLDWTAIDLGSFARFQTQPPVDSHLLFTKTLTYVWIGLPVDHPKLQDVRVRQAIAKAIDMEELLEAAYFGLAEPAAGVVGPDLPGYIPATIEGRDVDAARQLLDEAGYSAGLDLSLSVINTSDRISIAQVVQANLAEVGINLQIDTYDSGVFWSLGVEDDDQNWRDLELYLMRYTNVPDPSWAAQWFTCDQVGKWDWSRWCDSEFDRLHEQAIREVDPAKRAPLYVRMQELMQESSGYIFLTHEPMAAIHRNTLEPAITPAGRLLLPKFRPA